MESTYGGTRRSEIIHQCHHHLNTMGESIGIIKLTDISYKVLCSLSSVHEMLSIVVVRVCTLCAL